MFKKQKGFTLIELLVVIAIIGLLAGIVLVSLGGARDSARDARIEGGLSQIRTAAELYANAQSPAVYLGMCVDADVDRILTDLEGQGAGGGSTECNAIATAYCVSTINASGGDVCVSSAGQLGSLDCGGVADSPCN